MELHDFRLEIVTFIRVTSKTNELSNHKLKIYIYLTWHPVHSCKFITQIYKKQNVNESEIGKTNEDRICNRVKPCHNHG